METIISNELKAAMEKAGEAAKKVVEEKVFVTTSNPYLNKSITVEDVKAAMKSLKDFDITYHADWKTLNSKPEEPEEWIWVTGYKATESDMKCRDYQYELGKLHSMPDDTKIVDCQTGFHLCKELSDVFKFYSVGNNHRYFEVQALVRKKDAEEYGVENKAPDNAYYYYATYPRTRNKLAAKSIVFTRELTVDEILKDTEAAHWAPEFKQMAIEKSIYIAKQAIWAKELSGLGYSAAFSEFIADEGEDAYETAVRVASQPGLSMDMKVLAIVRAI
jgi:hypothetical protein